MAYQPSRKCFDAAKAAAQGTLSESEVLSAFERIEDYRQSKLAEGELVGGDARLRRFTAQEAERTRVAAAMQRRHTALNILARDKLDQAVHSMIGSGVPPHKALLAVLEGTWKPVEGGRKSVDATRGAYEKRFLGGLLSEIQREKPHIIKLLNDEVLDKDVMREMMELREGGNPGVTGNSDAKFLAETFAKYAELSRTDLNSLGASIGKLDGWAGTQLHDDMKLLDAGKESWIGFIMPKLDLERTFPDGLTPDEVYDVLGDIYDTIVTGFRNEPTAPEMGQRVSPANMAKALGKSRVLHFRDADSAITYREKFGYGNTLSGMIGHLRNSARVAGAMDVLGPNPEVMFNSVARSVQRRIKEDPNLTPEQKADQIRSITTQEGALRGYLRGALDIATGASDRADNMKAAKIGADIRAMQSMSKLGGAVISSITDPFTAASAAMFRGNNYLGSLLNQFGSMLEGRGRGEQAEIQFLIGEGFDGLIGHIVHPMAVNDGPIGVMGGLQEKFFKWNGLTWWTDVNRAVAARTIASELGMRSRSTYADLPDQYRYILGLHGIREAEWSVIGQATLRQGNGNLYLTPDRIRDLPDDAFVPLVEERIRAARGNPDQIASIINRARRDMELSVLRFFHDETRSSVITYDARAKRTMTMNTRPGTFAGEVTRSIMQFKGFPVAFTQRILGRAVYGARPDASMAERGAHIGSLLAGLTMAGYAAMTAKDAVKGYWPPRDPSDPRTWMAAAQQGGAWGIYGDFLFSQNNRFGGSLLDTLSGPSFGSLAELWSVYEDARESAATGGEDTFSGARLLNFATGNTPFANLFYVKPAMDYLWLNSLRESLSPGYMRRRERSRMREYGQERVFPMALNR